MPRMRPVLFLAAGALMLPTLSAQDALPGAQVKGGGATMDVRFAPGRIDLPQSAILAWISTAAEAVSEYFGRFPVPHAHIVVRPAEGRTGIFRGMTYGSEGGLTRISVGQLTDQDELNNDLMMTHELIHMGFPDIARDEREHHWIEA